MLNVANWISVTGTNLPLSAFRTLESENNNKNHASKGTFKH
jgi:hypothetical protein